PGRVHAAGGPVRGADDDHVIDDQRRRIEPDVGVDRIDFLIEVELEIDGTFIAERLDRNARLRVEREHPVSGRHVDDALIGAVRARPIRYAATGALADGRVSASAFVLTV